ncbi:MAG: protein-glutamate O-methyltransferase CheR [Candidatus Eisenbacteria bacterium]
MAMNPNDFAQICKLVLSRSAIVLETGKEYLVESRLVPLAKRKGYDSLEGLCADLRSNRTAGLADAVVEAMTTNETSFFRDLHPFDALKKEILPTLIESRSNERRLRIWSAASSSGQEIYSIGMLVRESFPQLATWDVKYLATDLSTEMVARSEQGLYSQLEVNRGLPAAHLIKYFTKDGVHWQIKPELRQAIEFRALNLAEEWRAIPDMDVVFLRNVLIYFSAETKKAILGRLRRVLKPDGFLFLGSAETTLNLDDEFERVQIDKASCYRLRAAEIRKAA